MKKKKRNVYISIFWLAIAIMVGYKVILGNSNIFTFIKKFVKILSPLWIAMGISYLLYIPSKKIEQKISKVKNEKIGKKARQISVAIVYVIFFAIIIISFRFLIPFIINNIKELVIHVPEYLQNAKEFFSQNPINIFGKTYDLAPKIAELERIDFTDILLSKLSVENVFLSISRAIGSFKSILKIFVTILLSVHILLKRNEIKDGFAKIVEAISGKKVAKKVMDYIRLTNYMLYKYIIAQLLDGIVIAVLMSIAFSILKVKYAIPLAILIGVSNLIPYFSVIGIIIAIVITLFTSGLNQAFIMGIVTLIIQPLDANVINPYLVGKSLDTTPLVTIISLIISTSFFGPVGVFLSVPIFAVILIIIKDIVNEKIRKRKISRLTIPKRKIHLIKANKINM